MSVLLVSLQERAAECRHSARRAQRSFDLLQNRETRYAQEIATLAAAHDEAAAVYERYLREATS